MKQVHMPSFRYGSESAELEVLRLRDRAQEHTAQWYALDNAARAIRERCKKQEENGK